MKDICANRHKGNRQSREANRRADKVKTTVAILRMIAASPLGLTIDDASRLMRRAPNRISGRFSKLKADGVIEKIGTRKTRTGCTAAVWRIRAGLHD